VGAPMLMDVSALACDGWEALLNEPLLVCRSANHWPLNGKGGTGGPARTPLLLAPFLIAGPEWAHTITHACTQTHTHAHVHTHTYINTHVRTHPPNPLCTQEEVGLALMQQLGAAGNYPSTGNSVGSGSQALTLEDFSMRRREARCVCMCVCVLGCAHACVLVAPCTPSQHEASGGTVYVCVCALGCAHACVLVAPLHTLTARAHARASARTTMTCPPPCACTHTHTHCTCIRREAVLHSSAARREVGCSPSAITPSHRALSDWP